MGNTKRAGFFYDASDFDDTEIQKSVRKFRGKSPRKQDRIKAAAASIKEEREYAAWVEQEN